MELTERECWFWLCSRDWLGVRSIDKLLGYFKTAKNIYYGRNSQYEQVKGISKKICDRLCSDEEKDEEALKRSIDRLERSGGRFLSRVDDGFPEELKHIYDVPAGLFYYGRMPEKNQPMIAIVGAREAGGYGLEAARYFGRELAKQGIGVISGLARGIDGESHRGALEGGGLTWGVLGCGLNICYPRENYPIFEQMKRCGGIISEYTMDVPPKAWHFPMRNRIISGLSDGVLVIEARSRSGSLITADMGLEQGKNIYALPGSFQSSLSAGCHELIQNGAKLVFRPEDILEDYPVNLKEKKGFDEKMKLTLDNSEQLVYASLRLNPKDVDTISADCGLSLKETIRILTNLELEGKIRSMGQNQYVVRL